MPTFPFERAKPAGWALGEILTSAQQNIVDANSAQAADGLVWSDLAAVRLFPYQFTLSGVQVAVQGLRGALQPPTWLAAGTSDMKRLSLGGLSWRGSTDAALPTTPICAASSGLGIVIGGDNGASASKYAYSTTGVAAALSGGTSADSGAATVQTLAYIGGAVELFVAGLSDGDIETSPTGQTWTAQTTPNAHARRTIETNGTNLLVAVSSASTDKYLTSTNATAWTERSFPASSTSGYRVTYSSYAAKWFAHNSETKALYKSSDAITWSAVTQSMTLTAIGLIAVGRVLCAFINSTDQEMFVSVDEGTTWLDGQQFTGSLISVSRGFQNNQIAVITTDTVWMSARVSDPSFAATRP